MGTHYRGRPREVRALDAYIKLVRASETLRVRTEEWLRDEGLTVSQLGVLESLLHLGPMRQCDLGTKLLVSRANVTLVVDQLAEHGWVKRKRDAADRRSNVVHLTPEGRRRIAAYFPRHARRIGDAFSALTAGEQEQLGRLAKKLGSELLRRPHATERPPEE